MCPLSRVLFNCIKMLSLNAYFSDSETAHTINILHCVSYLWSIFVVISMYLRKMRLTTHVIPTWNVKWNKVSSAMTDAGCKTYMYDLFVL